MYINGFSVFPKINTKIFIEISPKPPLAGVLFNEGTNRRPVPHNRIWKEVNHMMDTPSYEQEVEEKYDSFIKKSLGRERISFSRQFFRQMERQSLFSELTEGQTEAFEDKQASEMLGCVETEFQVLQYPIMVRNSRLCDALSQLDERSLDITLMFYWLGMTDQEIAGETGLKRRKVNDIRNKSYPRLKKLLEANGYGK